MPPAACGLFLLGFLCVHSPESPATPADTTAVPPRVQVDSAMASHTSPIDTLGHRPLRKKSPGTAMLLSAIFPGVGQAYNESYWKVPLVSGLGIYFVSEWLTNNRRYLDAKNQYSASIQYDSTGAPTGGNNDLLRVRDFYRSQRDSYLWYFVILYVLNIADAYVDASLFDFDVGNSLTLQLRPDVVPGLHPTPGLRLRIRF
jgi:hypothetical protein